MNAVSHVQPGHFLRPLAAPKKWQLWLGRVISAVPILMMAMASTLKLIHAPQMVPSWVNRFGWPERLMTTVGLIEMSCALLFAIPQTAVLGAILVTAFFGGAFVSHLRIGDAAGSAVPVVLASMAWIGLYLRDERLRSLIPLRGLWRERG
jgi:DoxX-like protein